MGASCTFGDPSTRLELCASPSACTGARQVVPKQENLNAQSVDSSIASQADAWLDLVALCMVCKRTQARINESQLCSHATDLCPASLGALGEDGERTRSICICGSRSGELDEAPFATRTWLGVMAFDFGGAHTRAGSIPPWSHAFFLQQALLCNSHVGGGDDGLAWQVAPNSKRGGALGISDKLFGFCPLATVGRRTRGGESRPCSRASASCGRGSKPVDDERSCMRLALRARPRGHAPVPASLIYQCPTKVDGGGWPSPVLSSADASQSGAHRNGPACGACAVQDARKR